MTGRSDAHAGDWRYPPSRETGFVETIHGRTLPDPYHWLDGAEEGEVAQWTAAQQNLTDTFFAASPDEARVKAWLHGFMDRPFVFHAFDAGRYRFMLEESPGNGQPVLLRAASDGTDRSVVIDPNTVIICGSPAILDQESIAASHSGRHVVYALKSTESPANLLYLADMETGAPEVFESLWNVFPRVSWHPSGGGFFYNQCQGAFIAASDRAPRPDGIYWHALGTPIDSDVLIHPMDWPQAHAAIPAVSEDGRYLFVTLIRLVVNVCRLRAIPLDAQGAPVGAPIALGRDDAAGYCYIGGAGRFDYFETDLDAPNGRVVAFERTGKEGFRLVEAVAEQSLPLSISPRAQHAERSVLVGGRLYLTYLDGGGHVLRACEPFGGVMRDLPLPPGAAIAGCGGDRFGRLSAAASGGLIADLWRRTAPPVSRVYDIETAATVQALPHAEPCALCDVVLEEVRYRSKDGTLVPMTILSLGAIRQKGPRPCLLYGYGAAGMSIVPEFGLDAVAWLALGGVYAVANIRGGGEFGERWHEAGRGANKQNGFDDFVAAAEYLIAQGIADPERLAIRGLSNGGLLVGACLTQRPDLFGAVIAELPLLDPLRTGRDHWSVQITPELGNPTADPAVFGTIARYSPLENLRSGTPYPPTLVVAADKDAQLLTDGSRKFIAMLQSRAQGQGPYLLHILRGAGHNGWTKSQHIDTASREIAFVTRAFGMSTDALRIGG